MIGKSLAEIEERWEEVVLYANNYLRAVLAGDQERITVAMREWLIVAERYDQKKKPRPKPGF